jgi:hypothetical protein
MNPIKTSNSLKFWILKNAIICDVPLGLVITKFVQLISKSLLPTAQKTFSLSFTNADQYCSYEILSVYSETTQTQIFYTQNTEFPLLEQVNHILTIELKGFATRYTL